MTDTAAVLFVILFCAVVALALACLGLRDRVRGLQGQIDNLYELQSEDDADSWWRGGDQED